MNWRPVMYLVAAVIAGGWTGLFFPSAVPDSTWAQGMPEDSQATTERFCSFGMAKGEKQQRCEVPILPGCTVANFPGTKKPWTTISKGGKTTCQFDPKATDWKTKIVGACTKCTSSQCSVTFHVRFMCS
ncbi:MAG TPA: hypothetical protein VLA99_05370 [Nitrospiraceae bacterium]|nr:hypothetical protein [Nitrospiraceae bacterium]